jgi:hypothetical protein
MRTPLLATVAALVALGTAPARAERDPDLGMDLVSPPGAQERTPPVADTPALEPAPPPSEAEPHATSEAAPTPALAPPGTVARSTLTTSVVEREPQDSIGSLSNDHDRVFYFTELRGFEGQTLVHRWNYKGEVVAVVPFYVGGPRWRVYSTKNLEPLWLGEWSVSLIDEAGNTLASDTLEYVQASPPPETTGGASLRTSEPSEPPPAARPLD